MPSERQISVGGVAIGGEAPVAVQSMTLTKTHDVEATVAQIAALASAGCEVVRCAVPKTEDAEALRMIVRLSPIPVIADQAAALVEAALEEVRLLEQLDFRDFKISVNSSHVPTMIRAYRMLSEKVPYPLHLGVTEAGTPFAGAIKSSVGIGTLLADGIGDTIRVSLTADPVEEIRVA